MHGAFGEIPFQTVTRLSKKKKKETQALIKTPAAFPQNKRKEKKQKP